VPRGRANAPCQSPADCEIWNGFQCNPNYGRCVSYTTNATQCGPLGDGSLVACSGSGTCRSGSCTPASREGGACDDASGPACLSPAVCVNRTCQLPPFGLTCPPGAAAAVIVSEPHAWLRGLASPAAGEAGQVSARLGGIAALRKLAGAGGLEP
jgi:hypothetical protein